MDASDFAKQYRLLTKEQFAEIRVADLVPEAHSAYEAEVRRRASPEYREGERIRLEMIEREDERLRHEKFEKDFRKLRNPNWFNKQLDKPRSSGWKLGALILWLAIHVGVSAASALLFRGMEKQQFLEFSGGLAKVLGVSAGLGCIVILSRPGKKAQVGPR